jgi:hypothetical protein
VDEQVCHVLGAGTELKHRKNLGERIDGQPQLQNLLRTPQPRAQFVQLEMWEVQVAEAALMEERCVLASASEPGGDGGLAVTEDPFSGGWVQPFCQRREHHGDLLRGSFQTV